MQTKKHPKLELEKRRRFYFIIGLTISLSIVLLSFEWRQYEIKEKPIIGCDFNRGNNIFTSMLKEVHIDKPIPMENKKPNTNSIEIVIDDIDFKSDHVDDLFNDDLGDLNIDDPEELVGDAPDIIWEETRNAVDIKASFPGDLPAYIGQHVKYPSIALREGVEGRVYVNFVVEKDGSITHVKMLRGIGFGCDEEALRVVKEMPKWIPAQFKNRKVASYFNLPIHFKLRN